MAMTRHERVERALDEMSRPIPATKGKPWQERFHILNNEMQRRIVLSRAALRICVDDEVSAEP